jgi:hypothetical protein
VCELSARRVALLALPPARLVGRFRQHQRHAALDELLECGALGGNGRRKRVVRL